MGLTQYRPIREGKLDEFVSAEHHCKHVGKNPTKNYIRQFLVDGGIFSTQEEGERCDYLLLNDTSAPPRAYYIELKGSDIKKAISQVDTTVKKLSPSLPGYDTYRRVIYRTGSHDIHDSAILRWKRQHRDRVIIHSTEYMENIS